MNFHIRDFIKSPHINHPFYVLIGESTAYSFSPDIHNQALTHLNQSGKYFSLNIPIQDFGLLSELFKRPHFLGGNITIPYKKKILQLIGNHSSEVDCLGAANTIVRSEDNNLKLFNTDIVGFKQPLINAGFDTLKGEALVFGSGGASLSVVKGLVDLGISKIFLVSRNPDAIADDFLRNSTTILDYFSIFEHLTQDPIIVVNATPLGMTFGKTSSPLSVQDMELLSPQIVYDLVYNPPVTPFLKYAQEISAQLVLNGLPMLIYQAGESFKLWTGKKMPFDNIFAMLDGPVK